jgi:ligand-binding sensor domain-containing protein
MLRTFSFLFTILTFFSSYAQEAYNWQIFSSKKTLSCSVLEGKNIWAGSDGGAYSYNSSDSSFIEFTKANGLNGSPVSAVIIDNYSKVWFGSSNGIIDVYDKSTKSFKRILAIFNSGKPLKGINNFCISGDTVIVSSDFGVSLINCKTLDFYDTFVKFGTIPPNTKVYSVYKDNKFFVSTQSGLAVQKEGTTNLNDPNAWDIFKTTPNSASASFYFLASDGTSLLAGTNDGLFIFSGSSFASYNTIFNSRSVKKFVKSGTDSYFISDYAITGGTLSSIHIFRSGQLLKSYTDLPVISNVLPGISNSLYASSIDGLLLLNETGVNKVISPNSPSYNIFSGITVDLMGNLYSASGRDVTGKGFYKYNGSRWQNFNVYNTSALPTDAYYNAYTSFDGSVYLGSYGKGFLRIKPDGSMIVFTNKNTPLVGISGDLNFLVVSALKNDSKGNLWVLNFDAGNRKTLSLLTLDSTWFSFENPFGLSLTNYSNLEIDQNDTKWYSSPLRNAIYYFNEKGTPANTADDISGQLTENGGLNGQKINALAIDKRGDLWVGTDLGVQIITSLNSVLQNNSTSKPRVSTVFSLRQQKINSIVVDPVNRKWIGTDAGLFLVSSDGTTLISLYYMNNSPILSNEISTLGSDAKTGRIFVGQTGGLVSFNTQAPSPNPDYSNLTVTPSPFKVQSGGVLTIDGLIKDSDIIILDIAGSKIKAFSSPGGRTASWDGKDETGNFVATGVYIIVVSDKAGNTVAKTKAVIIR